MGNLNNSIKHKGEVQRGNSYQKMDERDTAVLIIDVQEKLIRSIKDRDMIIFNIKKIVEASFILNIPKFISEQNPEKLGTTINSIHSNKNEFPYSKMSFSCANCFLLMKHLKDKKIKNILLCGVETHICVQQTALDLFTLDYNVFVAIDAVGSRNIIDHEVALRRIENAGGIISTTESVIFEWCKSADRNEFRDLSGIIKKNKA